VGVWPPSNSVVITLSEGFSHNSRGLPGFEGTAQPDLAKPEPRCRDVGNVKRHILHERYIEVSVSCSLLVNSSLPMSRRVSGICPIQRMSINSRKSHIRFLVPN
jgi:hypothetical protein